MRPSDEGGKSEPWFAFEITGCSETLAHGDGTTRPAAISTGVWRPSRLMSTSSRSCAVGLSDALGGQAIVTRGGADDSPIRHGRRTSPPSGLPVKAELALSCSDMARAAFQGENMPLSLSAEELDLLLELARPIDQRQREQFFARGDDRARGGGRTNRDRAWRGASGRAHDPASLFRPARARGEQIPPPLTPEPSPSCRFVCRRVASLPRRGL